eukprot:9778133-Ditylum_brightwellii.AAC.1
MSVDFTFRKATQQQQAKVDDGDVEVDNIVKKVKFLTPPCPSPPPPHPLTITATTATTKEVCCERIVLMCWDHEI